MLKKRALIKDLPLGVGVCKVQDSSGRQSYRVRLGKKFTGGQVITKYFPTLSGAKTWIHGDAKKEQLESHGITTIKEVAGAASFSDGEARLLSEALAAARKCKEVNLSIAEAVEYAIRHLRPPGGQKTLREACDFILQLKKDTGKSEKHRKGMKSIFTRVCEDLGAGAVSTFTQEKIESWLSEQDDVSLNTRISYSRHLHIVFSEAVKRHWCAENPTTHLERATDPSGDVEIWKPAQFIQIMAAALTHEPKLVAPLALKAFAGLRTSELLQLNWERVSSSKVQILGKTAKTRRSRGIDIPPNLAAWLKETRKEQGPVVEMSENSWYDGVQRICTHAGIVQPSNVLRHSFGTYKYHDAQSETETAYQMGNTPDVVIAWYRSVAVEDTDVENWWKITPEIVKTHVDGRFDLKRFAAKK